MFYTAVLIIMTYGGKSKQLTPGGSKMVSFTKFFRVSDPVKIQPIIILLFIISTVLLRSKTFSYACVIIIIRHERFVNFY